MATSTWIKNVLERRGIAFEELHHRVAFTAQEVAQNEHVSGHRLAKVVVVLADGRPVVLVLPASRRVVLDRVKEQLGASDIRLASEAEMDTIFTDCETGAVPPLRHWKDVAVVMDVSIPPEGDLLFQAGTHEDVIRLKSRDWFGLVNPLVGSFSEPEHVARGHEFTDRGDVAGAEWEGPVRAMTEEARARADCREAARGGSRSWSCPASIRGPGPIRRERPSWSRPPSSSTASTTSRAARSKGVPR